MDAQFILGLLSTDDKSAKKRYRELLRHGEALEIGDVLEKEGVIESFLERLISVVPSLLDSVRTKGRIAGLSGIDFLDSKQLDSLVDAVRSGRFRDKTQTRRAKRYLIDQLVARGYQRREIAQRLGVSRKTVYNLIKSST